jgi:hypothetical protein
VSFGYVGGAEPPGASFRTESATGLMEVFEGAGGMIHDDSPRGKWKGKSVCGTGPVKRQKGRVGGISDFPQLRAAEGQRETP